jgi:membrane peptidoglycan carboxypeptidase
MTRRGQLTMAVLVALGFGAGWWTALQLAAAWRGGPAGGVSLPAVAAGPPGEGGDPDPLAAADGFDSLEAVTSMPALLAPPAVPETLLRRLPPSARNGISGPGADAAAIAIERIEAPASLAGVLGPLEVAYTVDPRLTREITSVLRRGRIELGHVIVMDPLDGRVLAYVSTNPKVFPATRPYPMASLMKVVTAAAVLESAPQAVSRPCLFRGSPYALSATLLDPPRRGKARTASFQHALATSNNQCFAQLAVHDVGAPRMLDELATLGILESPGPGHAPGEVDAIGSRLALGKLGSGLAGSRLAPLAAARLAASLAEGELVSPHWIARVTDANGIDLTLPERAPRKVLGRRVTRALRAMLVETTISGTARRAFRDARGRPLLSPIRVAGKTGSLSGPDPKGRYEWFIGVAPADAPRVAVATVVVHQDKRWHGASQIAAGVLRALFCSDGACVAEKGLVAASIAGEHAGLDSN